MGGISYECCTGIPTSRGGGDPGPMSPYRGGGWVVGSTIHPGVQIHVVRQTDRQTIRDPLRVPLSLAPPSPP